MTKNLAVCGLLFPLILMYDDNLLPIKIIKNTSWCGGGGGRGVKSTLFGKIRDPPLKKKRDPTLNKARRPPTKIWPNFHLSPGQNLHEKRFLKNSSPAAPNTF